MKFETNELRVKLDEYFSGILSKKDLGEWAKKAYYDLLKGSYVEIEKVVMYPFLKTISTFHIEENDKEDIYPCPETSIKNIQNILVGKTDYDFDIEMSIPIQVYTMFKERPYFDQERRENFLKLRKILLEYFEQDYTMNDEMVIHLETMMTLHHSNKTVQDLLEENIFQFLRILFINHNMISDRQEHYRLFAQKSEQNLIRERLLRCLDCYIGNTNFHLLVSIKKGIFMISLIV